MTTPDLPPLPEPFMPLYSHERRKWADQMRAYGDARAAAAVLAEREKSEAMRAALVELLTIEDRATVFATLPITQRLRIADRKVAAIDAARDAIRTEPKKEKQP